jgi:hypothetical protein
MDNSSKLICFHGGGILPSSPAIVKPSKNALVNVCCDAVIEQHPSRNTNVLILRMAAKNGVTYPNMLGSFHDPQLGCCVFAFHSPIL